MERGLGRKEPTDWRHVEKYRFTRTTTSVERTIPLVWSARTFYDQGTEGACVGFSCSWMMTLLNRRRYDAFWLYREAQKVDEWPGEDYSGTSLRAGLDILREVGHRRVAWKRTYPAALGEGIHENRWATSVDEIRGAIAEGTPVVLGINWYSSFDVPARRWPRWFIGDRPDWGWVRGGHAICCRGASDALQSVLLTNSWGRDYPAGVWLPYEGLARLLRENGEAGLVTDRP
jgi:hypothetical protein